MWRNATKGTVRTEVDMAMNFLVWTGTERKQYSRYGYPVDCKVENLQLNVRTMFRGVRFR